MAKEFDFYRGFEGEPELIISKIDINGNLKTYIKLWIGFFDLLMGLIKPNYKGKWEGVTLHYHTETGWYDESPWKCNDVELFIFQLQSIDKFKIDTQCQKILDILIEILRDSVISNDVIYFEY